MSSIEIAPEAGKSDIQSRGADEVVALLKAGADTLRLQILQVLDQNSYGVLELCQILDVRQSGMSHHLKVLANAGVVATRREGNSIFYRRQYSDGDTAGLLSSLFNTVDALPLDPVVAERLATVNKERAESSARFFTDHADQFQEQQDLIASYQQYGPEAISLLENYLRSTELAVEIGPGRGEFLRELSQRFQQVEAFDTSSEMLTQAQASVADLQNVELTQGDTRDALARNTLAAKANAVVINMVLHHTPDPAEILMDTAGLLKEGGLLLVTDLCRHDQTWVHEACGDVWLGFEPDELGHWAETANLQPVEKQFFALRNGFQIQIQLFKAA